MRSEAGSKIAYDHIPILRYMGNKNRLLDFIIPAIEEVTGDGDTVCDLMAGTHCIGYALKRRRRIIAGDIQEYSRVIGRAIIENNREAVSALQAQEELQGFYLENCRRKTYRFFYDNYADTYFAPGQCLAIDSIRYAAGRVGDVYRQSLYLCALMHTMCKVQSTPGHFAQFMPKDHPRVLPLREMDVWQEFLGKCDEFRAVVDNGLNNEIYKADYKNLFASVSGDVACFYADPPYSREQYSRFYHILETMVKYDLPALKHKALYRTDRFLSGFCYKDSVEGEFEFIMREVREREAALVISYSGKGVLPLERLKGLGAKYFNRLDLRRSSYAHSTLGKGNSHADEMLLILE